MAQLRDKTISVVDIKEYLKTQDDFALELHVYEVARRLGLSASHGGTYEDPVTRKPRQYDLRAAAERQIQRIDLAIECKALRSSYPLVLSRIRRSAEESFHQVILSCDPPPRRGPEPSIPLGEGTVVLSITGRESIYKPGEHVGKSTAQVGRTEKGEFVSGDGQVFDKWYQALGSADDLVSAAEGAHEHRATAMFLTAVLPVLVVSDDTLWVADYSDAGGLEGDPSQASEATLFVGRTYSLGAQETCVLSHLHIYTRTAIAAFLERVAKDDNLWDSVFPPRTIQREIKRLLDL